MADEKNNSDGDGSNVSPQQSSPSTSVEAARSNPYFVGSSKTPVSKRGLRLPPFLQHLKNPKDLKLLFKCSLALWVGTILMFINPVLDNYGQATFFASILLVIAPPTGVVLIGLLAPITAGIGMCCAWAWGAITMKAALATRSTAETNDLLRRLKLKVVAHTINTKQATGQSTYTSELIYNGFALDTRVVVTYFCMLGTFVYLVARLRVAAPKLILFEIFGIIVTDIFFTIGPLLPTFKGSIAQTLVKPAATAIAISMVCNIFIFPESSSHAALEGLTQVLAPMRGFLEACQQSFEHHPIQFDVNVLEATRTRCLAAYQALEATLGFLELDWSVGRWNSADISSLRDPLRRVLTTFLGLVQLQISFTETHHKAEWFNTMRHALHGQGDEAEIPKHGHHQLMHYFEYSKRVDHKDQEKVLGDSMRALADSSNKILLATANALDAMTEAIHEVNSRRWWGRSTVQQCEEICQKHHKILSQLEVERKQFAEMNREHLISPHSHLFDQDGRLKLASDPLASPIRSLLTALVFEERMLNGADAVHDMFETVIRLEEKRSKVQFWPPTKLRHAVRWAFGHDPPPASLESNFEKLAPAGTAEEKSKASKRKRGTKDPEDELEHAAQRELDALRIHGGTKRSKRKQLLIRIINWFTSTEGLYALRVLIVTIAIALPAVIQHSSGFFYRERGLWALIMSQTGLVYFSADFVSGFVLRVTGTIVGGVLGMVAWYIGAGNGPGNPYGMAAITAVMIIAIMYCRLFTPFQFVQGIILSGATFYLIVGYSWDDTHIPNYGNPGVGYAVFWRRILLVIIGFTAAAIVTFLPKPPSATRNIANVLASNMRSSKDLYALLLSSWANPQKDLNAVVQKAVISNLETLLSLPGRIAMLKFEFTTSNLDPAVLNKVRKLCSSINQNISQLFVYVDRLSPQLKARFASLSGATDDRLVGDIMAMMSLLEQALKTGDPLPAILPSPLLLRSIESATQSNLAKAINLSSPPRDNEGPDGTPSTVAPATNELLTLSLLRQPEFRVYCVVLNAFTGILAAIDEMTFTLKGALGEEHVVADWESHLWLRGGEA